MSFSILQTCFLDESLTFRGLLYFFLYLQSPNGINYVITYFVALLCPYQHHLCDVWAAFVLHKQSLVCSKYATQAV